MVLTVESSNDLYVPYNETRVMGHSAAILKECVALNKVRIELLSSLDGKSVRDDVCSVFCPLSASSALVSSISVSTVSSFSAPSSFWSTSIFSSSTRANCSSTS